MSPHRKGNPSQKRGRFERASIKAIVAAKVKSTIAAAAEEAEATKTEEKGLTDLLGGIIHGVSAQIPTKERPRNNDKKVKTLAVKLQTILKRRGRKSDKA